MPAKARAGPLSLMDTPRGKLKGHKDTPIKLPFSVKPSGFSFAPKAIKDEEVKEETIGCLTWANKYRRIRGKPFSLRRHLPLEQIYDDDHPHQVIIKPAQVGISEYALTKTMWVLDQGARVWNTGQDGLNVAYLFPTQSALHDFSKERFARMRVEHEKLAGMFTDYDDVTFKKAGRSFLYLRGAWSETALLSFTADLLILDEFDRMDPKAVALARQRMRASAVKREIDISTPVIPETGIHAEYLQSDQHVWEVLCPGCGQASELDFFTDVRIDDEPMDVWENWEPERIRQGTVSVHCPLCHAHLDPAGPGRWHAKYPERTGVRGYWVPALAFPNVSIMQLCLDAVSQDPTVRTEFYRSGLGIPYSAHGSRITRDMLAGLSHELPNGLPRFAIWSQTSMGVDVGKYYHYRISSTGPDKRRYIRAMGKATSLEELDELIKMYRVRMCVIDALPEIHGTQRWAEKHRGRVLRALYPPGLKDQLYQIPGQTKTLHRNALRGNTADLKPAERFTVKINRTMAMDAVFDAVATSKEHWPQVIHDQKEVINQMMAPVRVSVVDDTGQEIAQWNHTSPDHYYHACVYDMIAHELAPKGLPGVLAQATAKGWNPE
jgi:hypothetical protein